MAYSSLSRAPHQPEIDPTYFTDLPLYQEYHAKLPRRFIKHYQAFNEAAFRVSYLPLPDETNRSYRFRIASALLNYAAPHLSPSMLFFFSGALAAYIAYWTDPIIAEDIDFDGDEANLNQLNIVFHVFVSALQNTNPQQIPENPHKNPIDLTQHLAILGAPSPLCPES